MVSNPMQKKARNSFLLGMIITLIVCIIIGALFYMILTKQSKAKEEEEGTLTYVYKLKSNIEAGHEITSANVESVMVTSKAVPSDAFASKTKSTNSKGKETWTDKGFPGGYKAKVDLKAGTVLSAGLVYEGEELTSDVRYVEYNMLALPTTVTEGEFVDIRLKLSNGQDLIVVSKKEIKSILGATIGLELSEGEILMMESAIVEAYVMSASKLYVTQYVEPGIQEAAKNTYVPTQAVQALIAADGNIVDTAKEALTREFSENKRAWINNELSNYSGNETENIETKLKEEIENAKAAREAYLSGLTSY
jgi:hypothetical protein